MTTTKDLAGNLTSFSLSATMMVCGECGIPFSVPTNYYNKLKETHEVWYCPNGHDRAFNAESQAERLNRQLKEKENKLAQTEMQVIQLDNQLTNANRKLKKVAAGQCPCCEKKYKHLAAHMKNKHPNL